MMYILMHVSHIRLHVIHIRMHVCNAACCSVLQCVAVRCNVYIRTQQCTCIRTHTVCMCMCVSASASVCLSVSPEGIPIFECQTHTNAIPYKNHLTPRYIKVKSFGWRLSVFKRVYVTGGGGGGAKGHGRRGGGVIF